MTERPQHHDVQPGNERQIYLKQCYIERAGGIILTFDGYPQTSIDFHPDSLIPIDRRIPGLTYQDSFNIETIRPDKPNTSPHRRGSLLLRADGTTSTSGEIDPPEVLIPVVIQSMLLIPALPTFMLFVDPNWHIGVSRDIKVRETIESHSTRMSEMFEAWRVRSETDRSADQSSSS
jgi:hypothetical protein